MVTSKGWMTAATALAMLGTPTLAAAAPATNPGAALSPARAVTSTAGTNRLLGQDRGTLISVGILAALVAIVLVATTTGGDDNNGGTPASR